MYKTFIFDREVLHGFYKTENGMYIKVKIIGMF